MRRRRRSIKSLVLFGGVFAALALHLVLALTGRVPVFDRPGVDPGTGRAWVASRAERMFGYAVCIAGMGLCVLALWKGRDEADDGNSRPPHSR